jgi:two-component system cell cycle sensor histidine kinase/response regulator CckA
MDAPLNVILNSLEDAILGVDGHSNIALLNEAAANVFGCDRAAVIGLPVAHVPSVADVVHQLKLDELSKPGSPVRATRRLLVGRNTGESVPMEATVSAVHFNDGKVHFAIIRDLSAQQQMEQAVYDARKTQALGALASGIAHDFNNVLAAVISQIDLALHAPEFPASLRQHLIYAQTSARRGAELVNKLQTFSRQGKPAFEPLNPAELIEQVVFVLRRSIDPKVAIHFPKPAINPWLAKADSNQIMQALLNLGINARDAMPQGGAITITVENASFSTLEAQAPRKAGDFVRIAVADTGHGMTPDTASRVFEPYFSTKDLSRGPGLGLSIAAAVVADHSGWMEVESQVGKGSRFSIFLPRTGDSATAPRKVAPTEPKAMEGKERILIVDDEELVRLVTKAVLAYRGYQMVEAEDGEDALRKYSAAPGSFDLILMDMHMPKLNGYDALLRIRELNPKARAIVLSGGVHDPDESFGQMAGVAFLHKPFENQELLRLVRQMLDSA